MVELIMDVCYLDESGTDTNSTVAVVAGVVVNMRYSYWLQQDWLGCLARHDIATPFHMRECGKGRFRKLYGETLRRVLSELVSIVNEYKMLSVASTLSSDDYRLSFDGISEFSMYGASYTEVVMINGVKSRRDGYGEKIRYCLDEGNINKSQVEEAHEFLLSTEHKSPLNLGDLRFESDTEVCALQAADLVSWSARRKLASKLKKEHAPLEQLFDAKHVQVNYEREWMDKVARNLRERYGYGNASKRSEIRRSRSR
jgi:Protein of unknown function (DUF3800)